jgi:hypothetical protein
MMRCRYCGTLLKVSGGITAPALPISTATAGWAAHRTPTWYPPRPTYSAPSIDASASRLIVGVLFAVFFVVRLFLGSTLSVPSSSGYGSGVVTNPTPAYATQVPGVYYPVTPYP